ncbi:type I 3-dehydroquinate dehydratase [Luteolibacter ambystomatis]|uniref:3-dehydroquinate dehydratase n=1 Tax=Luteolibacter ambystomatis TaxID=2824561 RepID=A0A975G5D5_9BACT|nr:type I 3-dehydroquinate dehydratase [Luteolibacter ambystomatis]QUE49632.1 type I 3-dehydroquinate dehydratase [Luteolibacter ambystomatis]
MISNSLRLTPGTPLTVGSFGDGEALRGAGSGPVLAACEVAEIRLDVLAAEGLEPDRRLWAHLEGVPLLFTARRREEGGAMDSTPAQRRSWLETALEDAAAIDIEVASLSDYPGLLEILAGRNIPLVASFHDFEGTPTTPDLLDRLETARAAGAAVFKAAARVHTPADVAALADFQRTDHGMAKALMGMGPLAPVSRLLCAQYGSVLNYGYLGKTPTAPGQWNAARLKDAIGSVEPA